MSHLTPLLLLDKERRRFSLEKELSSNSFRKHPSLYSLSFAAMEDGGPTSLVGVGGVGVGAGSGDDGASTSAVHKLVYVVLKASVGEARGAEGEPVMLAASASLGAMASEVPMVVAQMWLEQFARINSGVSPAEYATKERIVLLRNMENIVETVLQTMDRVSDGVSVKACTGRLISLATEEMTKHQDVVQEVQKPCSAILVAIGGWYIDRVMDALLLKFPPTSVPHVYTLLTVEGLAETHPMESVPYLKQVLETMSATVKSARKDALKAAYAAAAAAIAKAILGYHVTSSAAAAATPPHLHAGKFSADTSLSREQYYIDVDFLHEYMASNWITSRNAKVKNSSLDALSQMTWLVSNERLHKCACPIVSTLVGGLKKAQEPHHVSRCLSQVLDAALKLDPTMLEPVVETTLSAIIRQVGKENYNQPESAVSANERNTRELLSCCSLLSRSYEEKLVSFLISRVGSGDEASRLAALMCLRHLLQDSYDQVQARVEDIFRAVHGVVVLKEEARGAPEVQRVLADLTSVLAARELLDDKEGKDFLDFVVRLCSAPPSNEGAKSPSKSPFSSNRSLRDDGARLLRRLTNDVPCVQSLLWPHMMEYLLVADRTAAATPVLRCLNEIIAIKSGAGLSVKVDFGQLVHVDGPSAVLARLLVLSAVPAPGGRGHQVLAFLLSFGRQINKHVPPLWSKRIPLLQLYLKNHLRSSDDDDGSSNGSVNNSASDPPPTLASSWDQEQWELWLMELLDDTIKEIGLEEWNGALVSSLQQQLSFYSDEREVAEKRFLIKCLGLVLKNSSSRNLVTAHLATIEKVVSANSSRGYRALSSACAEAYGLCAVSFLDIVLEKLEGMVLPQKKTRGSFFGLLQDKQPGEQRVKMHKFGLLCLSRVVMHGPKERLVAQAGDLVSKFIIPSLRERNVGLNMAALCTLADMVRCVRDSSSSSDSSFKLPHHEELTQETILCLRSKAWSIEGKYSALAAALELVRCRLRPAVSSGTQRSLLEACLTSVLPHLINREDEYDLYDIPGRPDVMEVLLALVEELVRQNPTTPGDETASDVFELLEPYLRQNNARAREISLTILQATLVTHLQQVEREQDRPPSEFAPGPWMVCNLVPRCFDEARTVQELALKAMNLVVRIVVVAEKADQEQDEDSTETEEVQPTIFLAEGTGGAGDSNISSIVSPVASELAKIFGRRVKQKDLVPLVNHISDSLTDPAAHSVGISMVLRELLEIRCQELKDSAASLAGDLLCRLISLGDCEETRNEVLISIRIMFSVSFDAVSRHLLSLPVFGLDALEEAVLAQVWGSLASGDKDLSARTLNLLVEEVRQPAPYTEEFEEGVNGGGRLGRVADHGPLSALSALNHVLGAPREAARAACEEADFASVFVPLLTCMCSYFGMRGFRTTSPATSSSSEDKEATEALAFPSMVRGAAPYRAIRGAGEGDPLDAFGIAKSSLHRFFLCRGCPLIAKVTEALPAETSREGDLGKLCHAVCQIYEAVINFYPHFLPGLSAGLEPLLTALLFGRRLTSVSFFRQLMCNKSLAVDSAMKKSSLCNLLAVLHWEKEAMDNLEGEISGVSDHENGEGVVEKRRREAQAEVMRKESGAVRILCLQGLSEVGAEEAASCNAAGGDESNRLLPSVLSAFLASIDLQSSGGSAAAAAGAAGGAGVNLAAIRGLHKVLISAAEGVEGSDGEIRLALPEIAGRVRPFIDKPREAAAAIACFTQLSVFADKGTAATAFSYAKHTHEAMVSLLLHASSEDEDVRRCARRGLVQIYEAILPEERINQAMEALVNQLLEEDGLSGVSAELDYDRAVGSMSDFTDFSAMFPSYLSSAVSHFAAPRPRARACAVRLAAALAQRTDAAPAEAEDAEAVCGGLAALLVLDRDAAVREAAAAAIGTAFVRLRRGIADPTATT